MDKSAFLATLANNHKAIPIGTKVFNREFLTYNAIKFNEQIRDEDAELLFIINAIFQTEEVLFMSSPFYIAPKNLLLI